MTLRAWARLVLAAAICLLLSVIAKSSFAGDSPTLVVIVEGGGGDRLVTAIGSSLPPPWSRADTKAFAKAAKAQKLGKPAALDKPKTKGPYLEKLGHTTKAIDASGALVVRVPATKKKTDPRKAKVVLVSPAGAALVDTTVPLGAASPTNDASAIQTAIASELGTLTPAGKPAEAAPVPPPTTPAPAAGASKEPAHEPAPGAPPEAASKPPEDVAAVGTKPPGETTGEAPLLLDANVAFELAWRKLTYHDRVTPNLRPYHVDHVVTPVVGLELYPLARSGTTVLQDIGIVGSLRGALGLESALPPDGTKVPTTWSVVDGGLRFRFRLKPKVRKPPTIGLSVLYDQESFIFRPADPALRPQTPSVSYKTIRVRLDGRVPIGPIAVTAAAGYLHVLDGGDLSDRLRGTSVAGVEGELGIAVPVGRIIEVRAGGSYRRFFYSFKPEPGDEAVAGGAVDQFIRAQVGLALTF